MSGGGGFRCITESHPSWAVTIIVVFIVSLRLNKIRLIGFHYILIKSVCLSLSISTSVGNMEAAI